KDPLILQPDTALISDLLFEPHSSWRTNLTLRLRQWEHPCAIKDLRSRTKETHGVVPSRRDRQAVLDFAVAPTELDGDRTIRAFFRGDAVHRIGVVLVRLEVTLAVVDGK